MSLPDGVARFSLKDWSGAVDMVAFDPKDPATLDSIAEALRPILYRRLHIFEAAHRIPAGPEDLDTVLAAALAEVFKG